jgi:hypothetical protein
MDCIRHPFRLLPLCLVIAFVAAGVRAASIGGVVTASGVPVSGARVTLFRPNLSAFIETRTLADGSYQITAPDSGPYQLGVAALNYAYQETLVDLRGFPQTRNFSLAPETSPGAWSVIGNTLPEFFDATDIAILLTDGTIFYCHDTVDPIRFNPVTGEKTFPSGSNREQGCMNATLLADGRFIMVGGQDGSEPGRFTDAIPWVKTYNRTTDQWTWLADMQHDAGRWYPGLARLADGSLLVMGGGTAPSAVRTETCERFDLESETWTYTGSMLQPSEFTPSALLYTGKVLATWSPPQLYDPQSGGWTATGNFVQPARGWPGHSDHSLCVLADGRALAIGVRDNAVMGEIYNPDAGTWSLTSNPGLVREQPEMVPLPDGRVLVAAGQTHVDPPPVPNVLGVVKWCDLFDPSLNTWRRMSDMNWFREYHAVTLLVPDGRVVTTGGTRIQFQYGPTTADIEAFSPPYLFRGVRPQITSISSTAAPRGASIELSIAPMTQLTGVVLIGTPTTTHWVDGGIPRRLVLPVEQQASTAAFVLPTNPNILPLGYYMAFAMVDDIPSVARIIAVTQQDAGDTNGDGMVNIDDLLAVIAAWGPCLPPPTACAGDVNGDGTVNIDDLLFTIQNWG